MIYSCAWLSWPCSFSQHPGRYFLRIHGGTSDINRSKTVRNWVFLFLRQCKFQTPLSCFKICQTVPLSHPLWCTLTLLRSSSCQISYPLMSDVRFHILWCTLSSDLVLVRFHITHLSHPCLSWMHREKIYIFYLILFCICWRFFPEFCNGT